MKYKVEIYVDSEDDAQTIINMIDSHFNTIANKHFYALSGEFGKVQVQHLHYQIDTLPLLKRDRREK